MSGLNERQRRIRLESKLSALQAERNKLAAELAQVNEAFASLSDLVMLREPDKWAAWLKAQTEFERGLIIAASIASAVQAEREACAKIAEKRSSGITQAEIHASTFTAKQIAAAIRARGEVTK